MPIDDNEPDSPCYSCVGQDINSLALFLEIFDGTLRTLLCTHLATAGGFYHPSDTAKHSTLFENASTVAGTQAAQLESRAQGIASALNRYEEALDLLPEDSSHQAQFNAARTTFNREFAVASAFVHTMLDDFDGEFTNALDKALSTKKGLSLCIEQRPVGGRALPGIRSRMEPNPDCVGTNQNLSLAKTMDTDPALQNAIREILELEWPNVSQPTLSLPPILEGAVWVDALAFFERLDARTLQRIRTEDGTARTELMLDEVDPGDVDARQIALTQSRAIAKDTQDKRVAYATPIIDAVRDYNRKAIKKGATTYVLCPVPLLLGGCTGQQASKEELNALLTEKRIQKALALAPQCDKPSGHLIRSPQHGQRRIKTTQHHSPPRKRSGRTICHGRWLDQNV